MSGSCGIARRPSPAPCNISAEIKNRDGTQRWWCSEHGAPAWDGAGGAVAACSGAGGALPAEDQCLEIDPLKYPGGIALWGAVPPVYSWGPDVVERGIHVHARRFAGGPKEIDRTYLEVALLVADGRHVVDAEAAVNALFSRVIGVPLVTLRCPWCGQVHLDAAEFAVTPHVRHQCNWCGRFFRHATPSVSNPAEELQALTGVTRTDIVASTKTVDLVQQDLGGLAIWGSNPALVWTGTASEEKGIHVHGWSRDGRQVVDDTFAAVTVDGFGLDPVQVRLLMVQSAMSGLADRVVSLVCTMCGAAHLDLGIGAVTPVPEHTCASCGADLPHHSRKRKVVANPLVAILAELRRSAPDPTRRPRAA